MSQKPSDVRKRIRSEYKFVNAFTPFLLNQQSYDQDEHRRLFSQLPKLPPQLGQSILEFIDNAPVSITTITTPTIEICQSRNDLGENIPVKPKSSARKKPSLKQHISKFYLVVVKFIIYTSDDTEEIQVQLVYNKSNTPKYLGQFINVYSDNRLKRQCKSCPAMYTDLKGFNRHYESKHL
ncbi:hypothetical protein FOB64_005537 [Candida albicans]|uniref:C2H2-type domain-containing protein n=1 Tax=Candida albicans TaxID=5476 RepID=A0A8H6F346_CANAX|nr:hypothetical protein FOB64_005537 [Candida albicans]